MDLLQGDLMIDMVARKSSIRKAAEAIAPAMKAHTAAA
jgi:hypothetical protein